jgi:glycosyltransferase involved in cell wall biosynthesis
MSRLGVVGSVVYPAVLDPRSGDAKTWSEVGAHFDDIVVIAQTAGLRPRFERVGNVTYILLPRLPRLLDLFAFPLEATVVAAAHYRRGVRTWSFSDPLRSGIVCLALRLLPDTHLVLHIQGQLLRMPSDRFGRTTPLVEHLSRLVAKRADVVRVVSSQIASDAVAVGVPAARIAVVKSRCDTELFDPDRWREAGRRLRASFPGDPAAPVIGFLGTLNGSKGLDVLDAACERLARAGHAVRLVVAGDGPLRSTVERMEARGAPPTALLGRLPTFDVPRFLSALDVLVVPSHDEGMPRAVLEGMAMEVPVVASTAGGIPEAVEDSVTGLLVPPADPAALATAIAQVLGDEALALRMGQAGRQRVLDEFDARRGWERLARIHRTDVDATRVCS